MSKSIFFWFWSAPKILYYCLILCFFYALRVFVILVCFVVILWLLISLFLWLPTIYIMLFFDILYYRFWIVVLIIFQTFHGKHRVNIPFELFKVFGLCFLVICVVSFCCYGKLSVLGLLSLFFYVCTLLYIIRTRWAFAHGHLALINIFVIICYYVRYVLFDFVVCLFII